jgi:hypothetical protein
MSRFKARIAYLFFDRGSIFDEIYVICSINFHLEITKSVENIST